MRKGLSVSEMRTAVRELHRRKVHIHGMFVMGFDADTPQRARSTVSFALKEKVDSAQFLILTPLPGTRLYQTLSQEGRILDHRWDTYDGHHVKYRPLGFSPWELQRTQMEAHARFYSPPQVASRLIRGRFSGFLIGVYANALNRRWRRTESSYIQSIRSARVQ